MQGVEAMLRHLILLRRHGARKPSLGSGSHRLAANHSTRRQLSRLRRHRRRRDALLGRRARRACGLPFHRLSILKLGLSRVRYGEYDEAGYKALQIGLAAPIGAFVSRVVFLREGSVIREGVFPR